MSSWNCPKCNFNNAEGWNECNSCRTSKPIYKTTQEDRIKTLEKFKSFLVTMKSINAEPSEISWFEDKVKNQEDVVKKHQREYNLSILLNEKDSL
jgi:hypothetical protein